MYIRQLNQASLHKHLKDIMKYLLGIVLVSMMNSAIALSTDKQKDIEIEADSAEMDDIKGLTIYRGDVVVIQGSIRMTGHTMTVHFADSGDMELVIMQGNPATYRQLPDNSKIYDEAEALQMEYYALKDFVVLIDEALVTQEGLRFSGNRIEYDTVLSQVKAKGSTKTTKTEDGKAKKKKDGRVKITIKKKTNN
jgi:lipopolysaccharide export system protein LptA